MHGSGVECETRKRCGQSISRGHSRAERVGPAFEIITRRHHRKSLIPSQGNFCPFSELLLVPKYPEGSRAQQQTLATFKCSCISHGRCHQGLRLRPPGDTPRYHHSGPTLKSRAVTSPFLQLSQEPENRGATELHQLRRTQAVCLPSHQGRGKA